MDIFEIRRSRLKHLVGEIANGNVSIFAGRFGYSPAQISQYLSSTYNDGRSMGERVARTLEQRVSVPQGWLDRPMHTIEPAITGVSGEQTLYAQPAPNLFNPVPLRWIGITSAEDSIEIRESPEKGRLVDFATASLGSFAVQTKGHDFKPRIRSGEIMILEPKAPRPGDDVLFKLVTGEWMLMQMLYARDGECTFGSINERGSNTSCDESEIVETFVLAGVLRQAATDLPT
jgi:hypothetical protein